MYVCLIGNKSILMKTAGQVSSWSKRQKVNICTFFTFYTVVKKKNKQTLYNYTYTYKYVIVVVGSTCMCTWLVDLLIHCIRCCCRFLYYSSRQCVDSFACITVTITVTSHNNKYYHCCSFQFMYFFLFVSLFSL